MNRLKFYEQFDKSKQEDHILISRYDVRHVETVTYIIEKEGLITAFLETNEDCNLSLVGLLGNDAYPKLKEFVLGLAKEGEPSPYLTIEIKEGKDTDTYNISEDAFTRIIVSMQDAINAGIDLVNMTDIDRAKLIRRLKDKIAKKKE